MIQTFSVTRLSNSVAAFLAALLLAWPASGSAAPAQDVTGNWGATLDTGSARLRLMFKIIKAGPEQLRVHMDSLDQGVHDLLVDSASLKDNTLTLEVKTIQGGYSGTLNREGTKIIGQWKQSGQTYPLTLERARTNTMVDPPETLSAPDLAANKVAAERLNGTWNGTVKNEAMTLRLELKIQKTPEGTARSTLDVPDQGLSGIPLKALTYKDGKVRFEAPGLGAYFEGVSFSGNTFVTGQWHQASEILPLSFRKSTAVPRNAK